MNLYATMFSIYIDDNQKHFDGKSHETKSFKYKIMGSFFLKGKHRM